MDPTLALLIVSCQIFQLQASFQKGSRGDPGNYRPVSLTAIPAPQLTVTPRSPYYVTGQSVTLTCSQPGYRRAKRVTFFKDKTELNSSEWSREHTESHHISQLRISSSGAYSCQHCTTSNMGPIHCLESNPVWITVLEQPPRPFFSVSPKQEIYTSWEFINLTCSVSDRRNVSGIQFLKNRTQLAFREPSSSPFTHSLRLLPQEDGNYSCRYWVSDLEIPSLESNIIGISVTDPPPRPELKLDPPTGEVNEGNRLLLTCSTNRSDTEKRFHFYRDGVEMTSANEGLLWHSKEPGNASAEASVTILQARPSQTVGFACSYEEKNGSRWIRSPWSQKVNITVLAQFPKIPLQYAALAIPLPVLMVLLIVYRMRKKKASKAQQELEVTESKEETDLDYLEILTPRAAPLQRQEGSEVTYADVRICPTRTPLKPTMRNKLEPAEEEMVLYSRVHFQPTSRATK